ncbi:TetR family transcriptional regulator [Streptomyces sp. DSM 3412]|uniref:TetR family transcriptional regulator n=1 Tax=Streptomyces gottesmaniae TaxID=3075518 RepID=A0ABU2Z803_9ACTN|nr:TetR family transcriptional regulator [Streptomyces sp. DSM 3412]MDT0572490.1 TetR family transcriptional regulator [Streptomyces sp. DSM 3412]
METAAAQERPGLRERKKQRTHDALLRAALELFTTRGYEATTVDEIAEAVDVSQRTFFRYFAGKEEAALALMSLTHEHFLEAMRARPAHEAPLEAMRNAVLEGWDAFGAVVEQVVPLDLHLRAYGMVESTPALLAAHLRRADEMGRQIERVIAEREGLDESDPRPRVAVAVFAGVMRVTERLWALGDDLSMEAMRELTAAHLDALRPSLAEKWRTD